jgi:hypothetical protein
MIRSAPRVVTAGGTIVRVAPLDSLHPGCSRHSSFDKASQPVGVPVQSAGVRVQPFCRSQTSDFNVGQVFACPTQYLTSESVQEHARFDLQDDSAVTPQAWMMLPLQ